MQKALQYMRVEQSQTMATVLTNFYCRTQFLQFPSERELLKEEIGSFSHSSFLDFLAAEGLKLAIEPTSEDVVAWDTPINYFPDQCSPQELVMAKAFEPAWFELLSFLPSRLRKAKRKFFEIICEGRDDLSRHRATLVIRALTELPSVTLRDAEVQEWSTPIAQSCWDIAAIHWRLGITRVAEALVAEISGIARIYPGLVERLAGDLRSPSLQSRLDAMEGLDRIGMPAAQIVISTPGTTEPIFSQVSFGSRQNAISLMATFHYCPVKNRIESVG